MSGVNGVGHSAAVDVTELPIPWLDDIMVVDTPGTNAVFLEHEALTRALIPSSDMVLFVSSCDRPFSESERIFMTRIKVKRERERERRRRHSYCVLYAICDMLYAVSMYTLWLTQACLSFSVSSPLLSSPSIPGVARWHPCGPGTEQA